ncbi:ABC transporter substrate-binding protein [Phototrophicus methaneseepsis]|uniref:ABC transporter substrate-binding protein n=1 Tax=Phototrophicus methaneseepsis TaxID=2710758 RepID=A0A7S8EC84_9CHLR|nr:ABC transporter substrate-binding protein [Phototrophicus methaneseepsis]QPC84068.1 ABC transporter substrate-binding protein [Phototrophicus methaneseepsis]
MSKKLSVLVSILLLALLSVSAVSAQDSSVFAGAWPYQVPPDGHFNTFSSGMINLGYYQDLMEPPLAQYHWGDGAYEGMLAESFGYDEDGNYVVTLKDGIMWSDGNAVTSADVVSTFETAYLIGWAIWEDLESVEAVDDLTTKFTLTTQSPLIERRILTTYIRPASVYGEFATMAEDLLASGAESTDDAFTSALEELTAFRPEAYVASGPFQILPENISDESILLVKNEGGLGSDTTLFDEVLMWNGETEAVTPLVSSGEVYYATHGFPPATEQAFIDLGIDILRPPTYSGPALYFNYTVYPFNVTEFRQAVAHAIDREENGFVSLAESGIANECMCGFSDNLVSSWVPEEVEDQFDYYDYDPDMAAEILEGIGFTKGDDGIWVDDQGNRMAFELTFPAEYSDWAAAAENVTAQLNDFGFEITARGIQFQQQQQEVYDSNFQMAIRNWGLSSPFPGESFLEPFRRYNGQGEVAGEGIGGGMQFDTNVTYSGGDIDLVESSFESSRGTDTAAQQEIVGEIALAFNELLPAIPLWERYGNNPINRDFVSAPAGDDPVYLDPGTDHFMPYLIITGGIGPAE